MKGLGFLLWWVKSGTCPCCFERVRLTSDVRVPSHGNGCFGQGWPPFELSAEGTEAWIKALRATYMSQVQALAGLEQGVTSFTLVEGGIRYEKSKMDPYNWGRTLAEKLRKQRALVKATSAEIEQAETVLATWTLRHLV